MSLTVFFINKVTNLLPLSRCFKLKAKLYGIIPNYDIGESRLTSTFEIWSVGRFKIGRDSFIGHQTLIQGSDTSQVIIGDCVDISSRVNIITGSHYIDIEGEHVAGEGYGKDIIIKDGAWIGFGAIILAGVTIGEKAIVAAGSVVIHDVDDYTMVAGNPAVIKKYLK